MKSKAPKAGNKQKADKLKTCARHSHAGFGARKKAKLITVDSPPRPAEQKTEDAADGDAASGGAKLPETVVKIEVAALGNQANGQRGDQRHVQESQESPVMPSRLRRKVLQVSDVNRLLGGPHCQPVWSTGGLQ